MVVTEQLVNVLRGVEDFRSADHSIMLFKWQADIRWSNAANVAETLSSVIVKLPSLQVRHLWRWRNRGVCLTVILLKINGTDLSAQEWQYALFLR